MFYKLASVLILLSMTTSAPTETNTIFFEEQVIFTTTYNISKVLVPAHGRRYLVKDSVELPLIFFTVEDPKAEGGTVIYVLEDFVAYEILEGGRDTTGDYSNDKSIYFGAIDGLYKYSSENLSAKKYGPFRDDIVQLQKANNTDAIYILTKEKLIYKIDNNGTVRTRVSAINCALEFVLDIRNNIYYLDCYNRYVHIVKADGDVKSIAHSYLDEFSTIKLVRPPFLMDDGVPFFGDGNLYFVSSCGAVEKKDFSIQENPTAFSVDAALYIVIALNGKLYEYNIMEDLLSSMFSAPDRKLTNTDISRLIISVIDSSKDGLFSLCKGWYEHNE